MDDAPLHLAAGVDRPDGLHKPIQAVHAEQVNVQNAPAFEVVQHIQPEFAALMLAYPHAKNIFSAIHVDPYGDIDRSLCYLPFARDVIVDGVQKYHCVNALQGYSWIGDNCSTYAVRAWNSVLLTSDDKYIDHFATPTVVYQDITDIGYYRSSL